MGYIEKAVSHSWMNYVTLSSKFKKCFVCHTLKPRETLRGTKAHLTTSLAQCPRGLT